MQSCRTLFNVLKCSTQLIDFDYFSHSNKIHYSAHELAWWSLDRKIIVK